MSFNAAFSILPTADPAVFILTDTSTGSDMNLTGRTISLFQTDGSLLVPAIPWPIANSSISLNVLPTDMALNISVSWASSSPLAPPSSYIYTQIYAFVKYAQQFLYSWTQEQQANPAITQDQNFYKNKLIVFCEILSAQNAIETGSDIFAAQAAIERYLYIMANSNYYF